jgi:hypothetical protein
VPWDIRRVSVRSDIVPWQHGIHLEQFAQPSK